MTDRQVTSLYGAIVLVGLLFSLSTMIFMTVEFDEAWIIASHVGLFQPDALPDVQRVLTTGGLHPLVIGTLGDPGGGAITVARVLSFASLLLVLLLVERVSRTWFPDLRARMIVLLMVLATPGTLFLGAMGYGVMTAMLLLLSGMSFWVFWPRSNRVRVLVTGTLLGLAFATRWTLLPLFPLLLLSGALLSPRIRQRWILGGLTMLWGLIVFAGFVGWQGGFGDFSAVSDAGDVLDASASAAGLYPSLPTPARMTGFASRFFTLTAAPVILACFALAYGMRNQMPETLRRILLGLTVAFGVIALAWVLRSPFLHTRYIWPAVLMANLASGLILAYLFTLFRQEQGPAARVVRIFCLVVPLGLIAETYTVTLRLVAMGAGYETNNAGYSGQEYHFNAFRLHKEQKAITRYLVENTSKTDTILTVGLPAQWNGMQLSLLTQRHITPFQQDGGPVMPDWLITHQFAQLSEAGETWLQEVAGEPQAIFGYRIYEIQPARFGMPDGNIISNPDLYRFSLKRGQSQSGY